MIQPCGASVLPSPGSSPRARRRSTFEYGMVIAAIAASAAITGTCRNTPPAENSHATRPDRTAAAMFPARDQAALRPMRAVSTSRVHRPTVSAATAGSNTPLTTCIAPLASSTGQKLGAMRDHDGTDRQPQQSPEHGGPFAIGAIEPGADRCLRRQAEPSAHRADQPGHGRAPTLFGDQKDHDIGAQPAANVGDQEVQPVERGRMQVLRRPAARARGCRARAPPARRGGSASDGASGRSDRTATCEVSLVAHRPPQATISET